MRITAYCMLFIISELIKYIFYINDSIDPLNLRPFKKMLLMLAYLIKIDMVYLLIRLVYGLQSLPSLLMIIHFAINDLRKNNHTGLSTSHSNNTHTSSSSIIRNNLNSTGPNSNINVNASSGSNNSTHKKNSNNNNNNGNPETQPLTTTTMRKTYSFLPISLSTSQIIELLNPLLLYCFCKTIDPNPSGF